MTEGEVFEKLRAILEQDFRVPTAKITNEATFRGTFGMDSLDAVDFVYLASKAFGMKAEIGEFRELHTLGKVATFLHGRVAAREDAGG
jgi:acyl carrier protein